LPIPKVFKEHADCQHDKVKHCAVAIWQGSNRNGARKKEPGKHYLYSEAFSSARLWTRQYLGRKQYQTLLGELGIFS